MRASAPSELSSTARDGVRRASLSFTLSIASMIATIAISSTVLRHMASTLATSPDPRFAVRYASGAAMPFPVVMDHDAGFAFVGVFIVFIGALAIGSLFAARSLRGMRERAPAALVLGLVAVLLAMLAFSTTFSIDEYAYVAFGRLLGVHGLDPYVHRLAGGSTLGDPMLAQIASLTNTPLPDENYGPLWTYVAAALAWFTRSGSLAANVLAERTAGAVALIVAALGVRRMIRDVPAGDRERRTALFALHPLALYESAGAGHNDMLMVAPLVWAFALVDAVPWAAGLLAGAAIAVKYAALVALPFIALRAHRSRGFAGSLPSTAFALAVPAAAFAPLWPGWQALGVITGLGSTLIVSPQWLADTWFPRLGERAVGVAFSAAFACVFIYSAVRYARDRCGAHAFRSVAALLWTSPLLNPWYVLWLLPAAASAGRWANYAWWFGLFVLARYVEEAPRFPATAADVASRIHLLETLTVVILVAPLLLSLGRELPFQRVRSGDA